MGSGYFRASKLGTIVKLPDGRIGTTVYNGLDGIGIKWGEHHPPPEDFEDSHANFGAGPESPVHANDWPWHPDAMLRDNYPSAGLPCVGEDYEVVEKSDEPNSMA